MDISELFSQTKTKKNSLEPLDLDTNEFNREPEIYDGNTEYKLVLEPKDNKRLKGLTTQMGFRLREGNGRAIYWLGIMDNGYALGITKDLLDKSIDILKSIAESLGARIQILSQPDIGNSMDNLGIDLNPFFKRIIGASDNVDIPPKRYIASIEILSHKSKVDYETVTIGVVGNANAGKSTLIGTLVTGKEDDGRGKNRTHVSNHIHELSTGRTSSVGHIILGYTDENTVKYYEPGVEWSEIVKESDKVVKFFDMAGHEKYMKTTIKGFTHNKPDYAVITVETCKGITDVTKQHITLCRLHKIPFMILLTKVDIATRKKYSDTQRALGTLLKTHFQMIPNFICDDDDAIRMAEQLHQQSSKLQTFTKGKVTSSNLVPVIDISCVTGEGLNLLKKMIYRLKSNRKYNSSEQVEFYLENIYEKVTGTKLVVSGLLTSGTVEKGQILNLGPDHIGNYIPIKIKSVHVDKQPVDSVTAGHHCSFSIGNIPGNKIDLKKYVRKDMVILDDLVTPMAYRTIQMNIKMLNIQKILDASLKKISLGVGSSFIIQFNNIRRAVMIKSIERINTKSDSADRVDGRVFPGDTAKVTVTLEIPAYVKKRDMCVLTESHMFGIGMVNDIES
jgi:elongation factor 1-alpha